MGRANTASGNPGRNVRTAAAAITRSPLWAEQHHLTALEDSSLARGRRQPRRKIMPDVLRAHLASDQPSWFLERRTLLQSAGALLGASAFWPDHSALARDAGSENTHRSPRHRGQVGFMLAYEQFTVPQLVDLA